MFNRDLGPASEDFDTVKKLSTNDISILEPRKSSKDFHLAKAVPEWHFSKPSQNQLISLAHPKATVCRPFEFFIFSAFLREI
jgi:hypothetical protein